MIHLDQINNVKPQFAKFTGIYMSGFYINNPRLLTVMCLLFDQVYLPNHLEYVIEFSKKYKFIDSRDFNDKIVIEPMHDDTTDPFAHLSTTQRNTANQYLQAVMKFSIHHYKLFGEIIKSDFFPDDEVLKAELVKKGAPGEKNTYNVSVNSMTVTLENQERTTNILESGAIPIFGKHHIRQQMQADKYPSKFLTSLLAMKSIDLVLPPIKSVEPEIILQARYNLREYLPLFWAEMLRFSQKFKHSLTPGTSIDDVIIESNDFVDVHIRPIIIEINHKMVKDRETRFKNLISPNPKDKIHLSIGNPGSTQLELIKAGISLETGMDYHNVIPRSNADHSGLTFLLNLSQLVN